MSSARVLVAVASKHGATREIAERIAGELQGAGLDVDLRAADAVDAVAPYDAVVLGSAVYMGHWLDAARTVVHEHARDLSGKPVWLFSSGPVGAPPRPADDEAVDLREIIEATGAREHRLFSGRLDRDALGFGERALTRAIRAAEGDFRDWTAIGEWAREIAAALAE